MLDTDTKRRIDACRDLLVGKVPDPRSQVEQITTALIYKFMDDMDRQAAAAGGVRSFFINDYARYSWRQLISTGMTAQDTFQLYADAMSQLAANAHLPALFREIFKGAHLPYRDPDILQSFLQEINGFTYDHSEKLGDAFEYLLALSGGQADAGQFRTPRHIIDFIVQVINPQQHERILDPACGTAGFLVSAWKHILSAHATNSPDGSLTATQRSTLVDNIHGYDISPDMVRLSRVNLYLHGFTTPHIHEYDTLTNHSKWDDGFDVILANPPFMTPKGGIRPHARFSIETTRSEVLFVEYIQSHLRAHGRAAIIVPEGIIFQRSSAHRALRQQLVETSLVAVVSLPAGVFQPYSGVKTSILFLDKPLARQTNKILFGKLNHDGFTLNTLRRSVAHNDLPGMQALLHAFFTSPETFENNAVAHVVTRERIASTRDWNLNRERYLDSGLRATDFDMLPMGDVLHLYQPQTITSREILDHGPYKVYGANGVIGYYTRFNHAEGEVLITCRGTSCGTINFSAPQAWITGNAMVAQPRDDRIDRKYLYHLLRHTDLSSVVTGAAQPQITRQSLAPFPIPVPPLAIQHAIVADIEAQEQRITTLQQSINTCREEISHAIGRIWA